MQGQSHYIAEYKDLNDYGRPNLFVPWLCA